MILLTKMFLSSLGCGYEIAHRTFSICWRLWLGIHPMYPGKFSAYINQSLEHMNQTNAALLPLYIIAYYISRVWNNYNHCYKWDSELHRWRETSPPTSSLWLLSPLPTPGWKSVLRSLWGVKQVGNCPPPLRLQKCVPSAWRVTGLCYKIHFSFPSFRSLPCPLKIWSCRLGHF